MRQYLLGDALENRRGNRPSLVLTHRRIQRYQNRHRRVVDGGKTGEGSNQLRRRISARRRIDFLRGAGFPRGGPAVEVRELSCPVQYNTFHEPPQRRRRFRPDHSPRLCGSPRAFRWHHLIPAPQLRNDMRLVKHSSVGDRGDGADELHRRDPDFLPHRD